jgi:hypothetical protein
MVVYSNLLNIINHCPAAVSESVGKLKWTFTGSEGFFTKALLVTKGKRAAFHGDLAAPAFP